MNDYIQVWISDNARAAATLDGVGNPLSEAAEVGRRRSTTRYYMRRDVGHRILRALQDCPAANLSDCEPVERRAVIIAISRLTNALQ